MGKCYSVLASPRHVKQKEPNGWNGKRTAGDFTSFVGKFNSSLGGAGADAGGGAAPDGLLQLPGRLFNNGSSSVASLHTQQGKKGTNQDAMIVWEDFGSKSDEVFCGVFDGHGPYGHMVAKTVRDSLPILLCSQWKANCHGDQDCNKSKYFDEGMDGDWCESCDSPEVEGTEKIPEIYLPLKKAMLKAFRVMDKELRLRSAIDCFCSGSTAVILVKKGRDLILGNIGDSRAILATRDKDNALTAVQLTTDLKPNLPREAARIQQCKGRVFALQDEPEVPRVWLPFDDAPGLAMARAFGDFCLKEYGVISIPEYSHRTLTDRDQFIVLASYGVWDVLSNEEVVEIVASAPTRASAARILVDSAAHEWKLKYPTSKMDDCAVVCLFLDGKMDSDSDNEEHGLSSATLQSNNHSGNVAGSDDGQKSEPSLQRNYTVRSSEDNTTYANLEADGENAAAEEHNWTGLDGLTRVNSLVQLPRFPEGTPPPNA